MPDTTPTAVAAPPTAQEALESCRMLAVGDTRGWERDCLATIRAYISATAAEGAAAPIETQGWKLFSDGSPAERQPIWQWHPDHRTPAAVFYFGPYGAGWMWHPRHVEEAPSPPKKAFL